MSTLQKAISSCVDSGTTEPGFDIDGNPIQVIIWTSVREGEWVYDHATLGNVVIAPRTDTESEATTKLNNWLAALPA